MKVFEYRAFGLENLVPAERDEPRATAGAVVVKFHAASLNYRDVLFGKGFYNPNAKFPAIPLSDGSGEVCVDRREHYPMENRRSGMSNLHAGLA